MAAGPEYCIVSSDNSRFRGRKVGRSFGSDGGLNGNADEEEEREVHSGAGTTVRFAVQADGRTSWRSHENERAIEAPAQYLEAMDAGRVGERIKVTRPQGAHSVFARQRLLRK